MANHKSAEKRNRQRVKRTTRSRAVKTRVRRVVRQAQLAVAQGSSDAAQLVALASKLLDRAAAKHVVPHERASRLKSRLALHLNKVAAKSWAKIYDGHSLVTLRRAIDGFDITQQYDQLKQTKVLYVISKTDKLFDLTDCAAHALAMRKAGVDLTYVEMPSDKGHMASHADAAMWAPILAAFIKSLA